jgi:hypothetical protein
MKTIKEVSEKYDIPTRTLQGRAKSRGLGTLKGRDYFFTAAEVRELIKPGVPGNPDFIVKKSNLKGETE